MRLVPEATCGVGRVCWLVSDTAGACGDCHGFVGKALEDTKLSVLDYFILVPLGLVINATPGCPGGIGAAEAGCGSLFALKPFCSPIGGNVAAILHSMTIVLSLMGIVFYLQAFRKRRLPEEPDESA